MSGRPAALVTGASRGIGKLIVTKLAAQKFDLTVSARSAEPLGALAEDLESAYGVNVLPVASNMAVEAEVRALACAHVECFGRADVLVLNAGMGSIGPFADYPASRLDKLMTVNFRSAYVLGQELLPMLRIAGRNTARGGKLIAVASTTGVVGEPLNSAYGASKAALISWCEALTAEESSRGVSATAVCPGYVATDMTKPLDGQVDWEMMIPPDDVAEVVASVTRLSKRAVVPRIVLTRPGAHLWRA